jgi:hypothetical protein
MASPKGVRAMANPLRLDADNSDEVENGVRPSARFVALPVNGPGDANRLMIFTGTAIFGFEIPGADQENNVTTGREEVDIILETNLFDPADFRGSTTYAALAAINRDDTTEQGYRVTNAKTIVRPDGALRVMTNVAVGFDAVLLRMSYQAFVLVRTDP